jgi:hypothetical protein
MRSDFDFTLVVVESIAISEEDHITKLEKLIKIEAFIKDGGQNSIILLSGMQIEKLYQKIIIDFIENIRFEMNKLDLLNQENERKLEILISPKNFQNPELILDSLKRLSKDPALFFLQEQEESEDCKVGLPLSPPSNSPSPQPIENKETRGK